MKKITETTLMLGILLVFSLIFANAVIADESVHIEDTIDNNGTDININVDIQISGNDTTLREDVYGTANASSPEDAILSGANEDGESQVREICFQPSLQEYFNNIGNIAPAEFVEYLKTIGYDDETHINTIWNLCQQMYIDSGDLALQSSLSSGLSIMSSTEGTSNDIVNFITGAVRWLINGGDAPVQYKAIGTALASYFASKQDLAAVAENYYGNINRMNIRLEAVERTLERISPEEYCQVKVELMIKYNLSAVKCGENSTWYYKIPDTSNDKGYTIIGITALPESPMPAAVPPAAAPAESQVVQLPEPLVIASQSPMSGDAVMLTMLKNLSNEALLNGFSNLSANVSAALRGLSSSLPGAALQHLPTGMTGTTLFAGV